MNLLKWYREMFLIRVFEESVGKLFTQGLAPGTSHLSIGQEACAVGAVSVLDSTDQVFSTHRGHGHFLAKAAPPIPVAVHPKKWRRLISSESISVLGDRLA